MTFEQDVSDESFEAFSTEAMLNGQPVQVIIDTGVELVDENSGEMRHYTHLVTMYKSDAIFTKFDELTIDSKTYELQDIVQDDSYFVSINAT